MLCFWVAIISLTAATRGAFAAAIDDATMFATSANAALEAPMMLDCGGVGAAPEKTELPGNC